jgi:MFS family permease
VTTREAASPEAREERAGGYAWYALLVLVAANFFNYVDRHVLSIVGQRVKTDLELSDAQLGFLLGTAFAVFYGVVGIGMGRIADALSRTKLMGLGLAVWSGMTALSGLATNFASLAAARLGVGIGEATANPCSHSLLSDYFPARNRSAVMAIYLLGVHLGAAASLAGGGLLLEHWSTLCGMLPGDACRLADWRAVFFITGVPGLLLAALLASLREPPRHLPPDRRGVLKLVAEEMSAAIPPFTLFNLRQIGGASAVVRNLLLAGGLLLAAIAISAAVGDWPQWAAVALGAYSVATWASVLARRDRPTFSLTFGCPTFRWMAAGGALMACIHAAIGAWSAPYAIRVLGASPGDTGVQLGLVSAIAAGVSVVLGGVITDWWKRRDPRAPIWMILVCLIAPIPPFLLMLRAPDLASFMPLYALFLLLGMGWSGGIAALVQDLVLPRMRATAAGGYALLLILVSLGIGPYWVGKISSLSGSLPIGLYSILGLVPVAAAVLITAALRLPAETPDARRSRARAAGESL